MSFSEKMMKHIFIILFSSSFSFFSFYFSFLNSFSGMSRIEQESQRNKNERNKQSLNEYLKSRNNETVTEISLCYLIFRTSEYLNLNVWLNGFFKQMDFPQSIDHSVSPQVELARFSFVTYMFCGICSMIGRFDENTHEKCR